VKSAELAPHAERLCMLVREHSHQFKALSKRYDVKMLDRQAVQARVADVATYLHAYACTLSKLDRDLVAHAGNGTSDLEFQRDKAAALHFLDIAEVEIHARFREMYENADESMLKAADVALAHNATLPNADFIIPERSPVAKGTGRTPSQDGIKQFPGDRVAAATH
jgi:hypothetical protein